MTMALTHPPPILHAEWWSIERFGQQPGTWIERQFTDESDRVACEILDANEDVYAVHRVMTKPDTLRPEKCETRYCRKRDHSAETGK